MSIEAQNPDTIQQVIGKDGKPIPGLFAFDSLPRSGTIEAGIDLFVHEEELQEKLRKIDESVLKK